MAKLGSSSNSMFYEFKTLIPRDRKCLALLHFEEYYLKQNLLRILLFHVSQCSINQIFITTDVGCFDFVVLGIKLHSIIYAPPGEDVLALYRLTTYVILEKTKHNVSGHSHPVDGCLVITSAAVYEIRPRQEQRVQRYQVYFERLRGEHFPTSNVTDDDWSLVLSEYFTKIS